MNVKVTEQNGLTTVTLEGMLDSTSAPKFHEIVNKLLEKEDLNLVVEMSGLTYTSSQGIRTILTLIKAMLSRNGKLVFRNIRPAVKEVLDMAGISQAMVIE